MKLNVELFEICELCDAEFSPLIASFASLKYTSCCFFLQVFVNDQFLNWDEENRIKVRIISARAYHSLFMHNM